MSKNTQAFRTIREVADWLGVATHVLRFWESKFPQIKPVKRAGGRRYYRPSDMQLIGGIKVLLHDQEMTIRGAQKKIRTEGVQAVVALSPSLEGLLDAPDEAIAWAEDVAEDVARLDAADAAGGQPGLPFTQILVATSEPDPAPVAEPEPETVAEPAAPLDVTANSDPEPSAPEPSDLDETPATQDGIQDADLPPPTIAEDTALPAEPSAEPPTEPQAATFPAATTCGAALDKLRAAVAARGPEPVKCGGLGQRPHKAFAALAALCEKMRIDPSI